MTTTAFSDETLLARIPSPAGAEVATRLGQLAVGAAAVVRRVGGERHIARRLMEMGLLPGTPVRVSRRAPLGDPIELRVRGYALSIRRCDALRVEVGPPDPA